MKAKKNKPTPVMPDRIPAYEGDSKKAKLAWAKELKNQNKQTPMHKDLVKVFKKHINKDINFKDSSMSISIDTFDPELEINKFNRRNANVHLMIMK